MTRSRQGFARARRSRLCTSIAALLGALALGSAPGLAAARDVVRVEEVGAVPVDPDSEPRESRRDAAVRSALQEAVRRQAFSMLMVAGPEADASRLDETLGRDPLVYITRFQTIDDRGERRALFALNPDVELEYVVIVEVEIDRDRIRERLRDAGLLLTPSGEGPRVRLRLALHGLTSYQAYQTIRSTLMAELGVRSVIPVEAGPDRLVVELDVDQSSTELLRQLQRAVPSHLQLTRVLGAGDVLAVRVEVGEPPPSDPLELGLPAAGWIDTPDPNRY